MGRSVRGAAVLGLAIAAFAGLVVRSVVGPSGPTGAEGIGASATTEEPTRTTHGAIASATFVGAGRCTGCHAEEARAWSESDHAHAMSPADSKSVAGNFDNQRYAYAGTTTSFQQTMHGYEVTTDGPDGGLATFSVKFTFGVKPLQQYLVPFGDGRLQTLAIAWDTRPAKQGGQRWFHVYPNETTTFQHALHWTRTAQNWNSACAECHTTDFKKNYRPENRTYATAYSEIGVGCEACHGPGSRHVEWANQKDRANEEGDGLAVRLGGDTFAWGFAGKPIAVRLSPLRDSLQLETCARCHARRAPIWSDDRYGAPLADTHRAALLEEGLYYPDGQIQEEVYEYGSFLQSKMHAKGVVCTNCHDPHAGAVRQQGNGLCAQCHAPATFDTREHTMHAAQSPGARCVACHMPTRVYMRVDERRDHSFRVPRPDLAKELGAPDPCTASCHVGRSSEWAAKAIERHYITPKRPPHYGQAIAAGRAWKADAPSRLLDVVRDTAVPPIVRATALTLLPRYSSPDVLAQLARGLTDADPLVRRAAVTALGDAAPSMIPRLRPLLTDPTRSVRIAAATSLAGTAGMDATRDDVFRAALDEARASFRENADRADARVELANLELRLGRRELAERELREAIEVQRTFVPAYVNLADLLRLEGRDDEGLHILERGIVAMPDSAMLHRAIGLAWVRLGRSTEALAHLMKSAELAPDDPTAAFVWAVALHDKGDRDGAIRILKRTVARFPGHVPAREALTAYEVGRR